MTSEDTLARFREYMVGPAKFMNVVSTFELGIVDLLRETPGMTAGELGDAVGAKPDHVEQLLHLPVKEGLISYDPVSYGYSLDALAGVPRPDLQRALTYMNMIKVVAMRQLFWLSDSVRTRTLVGLEKLYGFEGTLYDAVGEHRDLRESWATLMNTVTARVDPWFFERIDIPAGARVLDLAGNTGLGAINAYRMASSSGLTVTTFDLPEKEQEALANFREHGVADHCTFVGGNVFDGVPSGFDVVLIKHFLDMFDHDDVSRILGAAHSALEVGGQVHVMVPVYPEDVGDRDNYNVDFFPAFFLGATMGQGGPQKLSTYRKWLDECGFTVTATVTKPASEIPPDVIPVQAILSATRNG